MKTVDVTKQSRAVNALLDKARLEDVLVRAADGSEFLLTAVDAFAQEITRTRENKKLMAFLERRATEPSTSTLEQVKRRLGLDNPRKLILRKSPGQRSRA
jgi:hypothetical protein